VAAAAVVLLGGAGTAGCDLVAGCAQDVGRVLRPEMMEAGGAAPDEPPPRDTAMPAPTGIAPDIPPEPEPPEPVDPDAPPPLIPELEEPPGADPEPDPVTRGIRPDIPPERVDIRLMETTGGAEPDEPEPVETEPLPRDWDNLPNAGVRPILPDPAPPPPPPPPPDGDEEKAD